MLRKVIKKIYIDFYRPYKEDVTGVMYAEEAYAKIVKYFKDISQRSLDSFKGREQVMLIKPK